MRQSTANLGDAPRGVHLGGRESDMYELFCGCESFGTKLVFRTGVDRRTGGGGRAVADVMDEGCVKAVHRIAVRGDGDEPSTAVLELKYDRMTVCPPLGQGKRYGRIGLTVTHATGRGVPRGRERIGWKRITNLPVRGKADAVEEREWYALRWKIETLHKVLKSGCRAEDSKLRTAARLANRVAMSCLLAWRVLWLTMVNRAPPARPAALVFTEIELDLLDRLVPETDGSGKRTVGNFLIRLARLGGHLNRKGDSPPGNTVLWRVMARLTDVLVGYDLARDVGN